MAEIITFYSYKGGTGRTMALANIAWLLASNNKRVLAIDWDMEAPGLHQYFRPFLPQPSLDGPGVHGIIDSVIEYAAAAATPRDSAADPREANRWIAPYANIAQNAIRLRWPNGQPLVMDERGVIDLVPSGRQDSMYSTRVNSFDWKHLYEALNGREFFEQMRQSFAWYDYVLIDSRTGVSDTSGICTIQMPDKLLLCFTLNNQGISGSAGIAATIAAARPDLPIYPALFRVDGTESDKANQRRAYAQETFDPMLARLKELRPSDSLDNYWGRAEIPYFPKYAYEELLTPFEQFSERFGSLAPAFQKIGGLLTGRSILTFGWQPDPDHKNTVVTASSRTPGAIPLATAAEKEPAPPNPARLRLAAVLWLIAAVAVVGFTVRLVSPALTPNRTLASALVNYAMAHQTNSYEAASALAAAADLPAPPGVEIVARQIVQQGVPSRFVSGQYTDAALSPDGKTLAVTSSRTIRIINLRTGEIAPAPDVASIVDPGVAFSPDGSGYLVFPTSRYGSLSASAWNLATAKPLWQLDANQLPDAVLDAALSPDGSRVALLIAARRPDASRVYIYAVQPGNHLDLKSQFPDSRSAPRISTARKTLSADANLVALEDDQAISIWKIPDETQLFKRPISSLAPVIPVRYNAYLTKALIISSTAATVVTLAAGSADRTIHLSKPVSTAALSAAGDVAIVYADGSFSRFSAAGDELQIASLGISASSVNFSADGKACWTMSAGKDAGFYEWRWQKPRPSANAAWPQIAAYLKAVRGACMTPQIRQEIFGETPDVAAAAVKQCTAAANR